MNAPLDWPTRLLRPPKWRLAVAESLTCGQLQSRIGAISGASNFFSGGITAYTIDQKVRHLGVDRAAAEAVNGVSAEVAAQMARGASHVFDADCAIATTGYAEPSPDWNVSEPFAFWAVYFRPSKEIQAGRVSLANLSRTDAQSRAAEAALDAFVAALLAQRP